MAPVNVIESPRLQSQASIARSGLTLKPTAMIEIAMSRCLREIIQKLLLQSRTGPACAPVRAAVCVRHTYARSAFESQRGRLIASA